MQSMLHERGWRPSWAEVLHLSLCMASGLQAVHEAGLVHRDIKPGNVLLGPSGTCVLSDFGLADHLANLRASSASAPSGGFHKQRIVGTLQYLAPEILLNNFHTQVCTAHTVQLTHAVMPQRLMFSRTPSPEQHATQRQSGRCPCVPHCLARSR